MGIINVTPDSFSDGGAHFHVEPAVTSAWGMLDAGAAIVDVGGESTRPGSRGVSVEEELRRVEPVLLDLAGAPVSIDTSKAAVARRALELGAELVNDVTALRSDPELAGVVADAGCYLCLMHMQGEPRTMQVDPRYDDVVSDVKAFLEERLAFAVSTGVKEEHVCLDPGIGFGKTVDHNLELVRRLGELAAIGRPLLVGLSRKSSLAKLTGTPLASAAASVGGAVTAYERGATILRVHVVGYHGVEEEEKRLGQLFLFDVQMEVGARGASDRLEDAIDYTQVAAAIRELSNAERFDLIEALATRTADLLYERFQPERVRVRVRKPQVKPAGMTVEYSAATVERP